MKNKNKSKKVQEYVSAVASAAKHAGKSRQQAIDDERRRAQRDAVKKAKEAQELVCGLLLSPAPLSALLTPRSPCLSPAGNENAVQNRRHQTGRSARW
jgi:hypothetical protein